MVEENEQNADLRAVSEALGQRLKQNDEGALEEILQRFGPYVRIRLKGRFEVLSELELDDVLSRGLFRLWNYRDRYDWNRTSIFTWFYLIARSSAVDLLREKIKGRQPEGVRGASERKDVASVESRSAPEEKTAESIPLALLRELLGAMSDVDRYILSSFAHCEGLGNWASELANELGMPASTVRSRKRRALMHLREQLEKHGFH